MKAGMYGGSAVDQSTYDPGQRRDDVEDDVRICLGVNCDTFAFSELIAK